MWAALNNYWLLTKKETRNWAVQFPSAHPDLHPYSVLLCALGEPLISGFQVSLLSGGTAYQKKKSEAREFVSQSPLSPRCMWAVLSLKVARQATLGGSPFLTCLFRLVSNDVSFPCCMLIKPYSVVSTFSKSVSNFIFCHIIITQIYIYSVLIHIYIVYQSKYFRSILCIYNITIY